MNIIDFFIIYLAFGAPCGVYFFFQNRNKFRPNTLLLKSFLTVFVWIPYGFKLLHDFATAKFRTSPLNAEFLIFHKLNRIQKQLLRFLVYSPVNVSLFEFREILNRYRGLSMACNFTDKTPARSEIEFFRISLQSNIEMGANCLHRRNYLRLKFHQTQASKDFLQVINKLMFSGADRESLRRLTFEFVKILEDVDTLKSLDGIFNKTLQSTDDLNVKDLEKVLWKSRERKQLSANREALRSQTMKMTATTKKD